MSNTLNTFLESLHSLSSPSLHPLSPTYLYVSYYKDRDPARQSEIDTCLRHNISHFAFKHIFIFNESDDNLSFLDFQNNITVLPVNTRLTFFDFFQFVNLMGTDQINVLINSDILIGKGFDTIHIDPSQIFCLSRHELHEDGSTSITVGGGSHDAWIWRGPIKGNIGNFYMGKMLCDGVLANQFAENGYQLKNPAKGLFIYHYHLTNVRNYGWYDSVKGRRRGILMSEHDHIFSKNDLYEDGCNV